MNSLIAVPAIVNNRCKFFGTFDNTFVALTNGKLFVFENDMSLAQTESLPYEAVALSFSILHQEAVNAAEELANKEMCCEACYQAGADTESPIVSVENKNGSTMDLCWDCLEDSKHNQ